MYTREKNKMLHISTFPQHEHSRCEYIMRKMVCLFLFEKNPPSDIFQCQTSGRDDRRIRPHRFFRIHIRRPDARIPSAQFGITRSGETRRESRDQPGARHGRAGEGVRDEAGEHEYAGAYRGLCSFCCFIPRLLRVVIVVSSSSSSTRRMGCVDP